MLRLVPVLCSFILVTAFFLGNRANGQPEPDPDLDPDIVEQDSGSVQDTLLVLDQIERIEQELNELSTRGELPEKVALAATSALIYIAFNLVHNRIINFHDPEYDILQVYSVPDDTWSVYAHIMTLINYLLPAGLVGTLTMTLAKYHDDLPEISSMETLKVQAFAHLGLTLPFTLLQYLASYYDVGMPFMTADQTSALLQRIAYYGPYAVASIYYTLTRMSQGTRETQLALQLRGLRQQLPDISAKARQKLIQS